MRHAGELVSRKRVDPFNEQIGNLHTCLWVPPLGAFVCVGQLYHGSVTTDSQPLYALWLT